MERQPKQLPKKDREMAERLGGSDIDDWRDYKINDQLPYFDRGGHKERGEFHRNLKKLRKLWRDQE